jgi:hypothetical protein
MTNRGWWSVGACLVVAACGSSKGSGGGGGPSDSGASDVTVADAGDGEGSTGDGAVAYPAFMPAMPQIQKGTLSVITAPVFVPVYFSGETLRPDLDMALSTYLASPEFKPSVAEYGVTSARAGTSIVLTEAAGTKLSSSDIETWLDGKLGGTNAAFGPVDATTLGSKVFILYYPSTTTITLDTSQSCTSFGAYHAGATLTSGAVANYIVVPRCAPGTGQTQTDELSISMSGILVAAATDPIRSLTPTMTGWASFGAAHIAFDNLGGEVGSACDQLPAIMPTGGSAPVVRTWSNAAALAYHDPCLPAPSGAYFVSVPVVSDMVTSGTVTTTGVLVPKGTSKTIDVQLLSHGPAPAWNVSAVSFGAGGFTYTFDQPTGQNGDTRKLTITAPATAAQDTAAILSGPAMTTTSFWLFAVQSM